MRQYQSVFEIIREAQREEKEKYFFRAVDQMRYSMDFKNMMYGMEEEIGVTTKQIQSAVENEDRETMEEYLDILLDYVG